MQLVDDALMRVQTVQRRSLGRQRLELRRCLQHMQVVRSDGQPELGAQPRISPRHRLRVTENDPRLLPSRRQRVALRAALAVRAQHVEPYARREGTLRVAPWDLDVHAPESPMPLLVHPAEHGSQDEDLPRLKHNLLAG